MVTPDSMRSAPQVFVDFNDTGNDGEHLHACYPGHVRDQTGLRPGDQVVLTDCESMEADGVVAEIYSNGRGDLVSVALIPYSVRDIELSAGWAGPAE